MKLMRVLSVEPLYDHVVRVVFSDDTVRDIDLRPYLRGEIFESVLNDDDYFRTVHVENRTVSWDNGADIDPNTLYYELTPASAEGDEDFARAFADAKNKLRQNEGRHIPHKPVSHRVDLR